MPVFHFAKTVEANMLFLVLSLVICSSLANPISDGDSNQKLIGATPAYTGQFPYQASLRWSSNGNHFCGGSIISEDWILTGARCIVRQTAASIRIVVGSIYLNVGGTTYNALVLIPHNEYDINLNINDVGLIRVVGRISLNSNVSPVGLSSDPSSLGLPLGLSGWGLTSYPSTVFPNTLQWLSAQAISTQECEMRLPGITYDTQLCTAPRFGQGTCEGDFGTPLVFAGQQHGISSWVISCGEGYPDVFTRVSIFRDWIASIANV